MAEPIRFKFKFLTAEGQETGFLSKVGSFDGAVLTLDKTPIPIEAVLRATMRFNRLVLNLLQENGSVQSFAIAITRGNVRKIMSALNHTTSRRWSAMRADALEKQGRGHVHRTRECPYCSAAVDLSELKDTIQMFCPYCDSVVTWRVDGPVEEADLHLCDGCGLYSRPRGFTIMYFWCLLVVWGYRYQRVYRCNACMRPEAWKMLLGNSIFILGVPVALTQLFRVYSPRGKSFAGLDRANALARSGQIDSAAYRYCEIEQRLVNCATVRFNHGVLYARAERWEEAAEQFRAALSDCSNFVPALEGLRASLQKLGRTAELAELEAAWGDDAREGTEPLAPTPTTRSR
jgi:hypothetical protein